jgi:VanZ family protein
LKSNRVKIINFILLSGWMLFIFLNSSKDATQSSLASSEFTHSLLNFLTNIGLANACDINSAEFAAFEGNVRTCAHFVEFMVLGLLSYQFFRAYYNKKSVYKILIPIAASIAYAITDELHQLFVPGRACDIFDVIVDTAGIITGVLIFHLLTVLVQRRRNVDKNTVPKSVLTKRMR